MESKILRRDVLSAAAAAALPAVWPSSARALPPGRPKVAAIFTVLRFRSHAFNILENFLGPYYFNGHLTDPGVDVVSFYADQFPNDDMAREVSRRFGIPLYDSIDEAMCLGGDRLAVDAVLSIGEHGDYPYNKLGQHMYPRKRFFDQAIAVMQRSDRYVPLFNDKHLSYRWDWSRKMFDTARQHSMPLITGSSVPLAQRRPAMTVPDGTEIEEAVSIHGGGLESYDFHAFEVLQSFVEARAGGETGITEVQLLTGVQFEQARQSGLWSQDLVDAAMKAEENMRAVRQRRPTSGVFAKQPAGIGADEKPKPRRPSGDYAIRIKYNDGLRATVLKIGSSSDRWNFACRLKGEARPRATALFNGPWGNRCLFKALSHAIQHTYTTGEEPYAAERTLLTTGAVDAVMRSWNQNGNSIPTPHLNVRYQPTDFTTFRESGATWSVITKGVPQSSGFEPRSYAELEN
ncbi:MAG: hypothetical protein P8K08_06310 [Fuerstiella sp.]|nr:hypothetical protein [Fuerstiella sp.]